MKLTVLKREGAQKSQLKAIRREGNIPAVLYGNGSVGEKIYLKGADFNAGIREIKERDGQLATKIFELELDGSLKRALIKDIQYHPVTYAIEHIDFIELSDQRKVTVNVPIEIHGAIDCPGVKLGGILRQVIRSLKVSCLPADIPTQFVIDARSLGLQDTRRLSDITIPGTVEPLAKMNEVAVVVAKGKGAA